MSSIRPLATVTILIGVGVVLWMKINETEPPLPDGLGDWQIDQGLQVGGGSDASLVGSMGSPPETSFAGGAPRYQSGNSQAAAPSGDVAPSWNPTPAPLTESTPPENQLPPAVGESELPSAPDLPPLPGVVGAAAPGATEPPASGGFEEQVPLAPVAPADAPQGFVGSVTPRVIIQEEEEERLGIDVPETPELGVQTPEVGESAPGNAAESKLVTPTAETSMYAVTRDAVKAALDRGKLGTALLLLSAWDNDPSLSPQEAEEVQTLLNQLAGTVIYSRESRLEDPYLVKAGDTLGGIAAKYDVPPELLAKINGVRQGGPLPVGLELKVLRGKFAAEVDVSARKLTLKLARHYAGRFNIDIAPDCSVEDGEWVVQEKSLVPAGGYRTGDAVERSVVLAKPAAGGGQVAVIRGPVAGSDPAAGPPSRRISLKESDIHDVFDILSVGSRVIIRR